VTSAALHRFKLPPLVPSEFERAAGMPELAREIWNRGGPILPEAQHQATAQLIKEAARDSAIAMLDAVIALLREPDEELVAAVWNAMMREYREAIAPAAMRALADELERRKP